MKKIIFSLVILSFMLTGCGKKSLVCTSDSTNIGKSVKTKIVVDFKKGEAVNLVTHIDTTYEQEYLEELEANYNNFEKTFKEYDDLEGVKTKLNKEDNLLSIELGFDMTKEDAISNSGFEDLKTFEDFEENFVKSGYKCN